MRRAERIRRLRAIERDLDGATRAIYRTWDELRNEGLETLIPGMDPATVALRGVVKDLAFDKLGTEEIAAALGVVSAVRRLMDGKP